MDFNTTIAKIDIEVSSFHGKINEIKTKNGSIGKELIGPIKKLSSLKQRILTRQQVHYA